MKFAIPSEKYGANIGQKKFSDGQVILGKKCSLRGDIVYRKLSIEDGAQFEGKCDLVHAGEAPESL